MAGIGAAGPPTRVLLGRARIAADGLGLAPLAEGYARNGVWRFAQMRIENDAATLPAALTKNYVRQESYADTCEALNRAGANPTQASLIEAYNSLKNFPTDTYGSGITCTPEDGRCNKTVVWLRKDPGGPLHIVGTTTVE